MDAIIYVAAAILLILGIVGSFVPMIPGPPLSYAGVLILIPTALAWSTTSYIV